MIKNYLDFINEEWFFNKEKKGIEVPELESLDDLEKYDSQKVKNRPLSEGEKKLVNDYISKFEKVFLMSDELIRELLLDIDLIVYGTNIQIRKVISRGTTDITQGTEFSARDEIKDLLSLINLKRWYDEFTNIPIYPTHIIDITKKSDGKKLEFDNKSIHGHLKEILKDTFKSYCKCNIDLRGKGGPFHIGFKIAYPKATIQI